MIFLKNRNHETHALFGGRKLKLVWEYNQKICWVFVIFLKNRNHETHALFGGRKLKLVLEYNKKNLLSVCDFLEKSEPRNPRLIWRA